MVTMYSTLNNAKLIEQGGPISKDLVMTRSTITNRFQTTIPVEVRQALNLTPRQRISYEVRPDGSAVLRPIPSLEDLFGSVKLNRPVASTREEKRAAREAIVHDAGAPVEIKTHQARQRADKKEDGADEEPLPHLGGEVGGNHAVDRPQQGIDGAAGKRPQPEASAAVRLQFLVAHGGVAESRAGPGHGQRPKPSSHTGSWPGPHANRANTAATSSATAPAPMPNHSRGETTTSIRCRGASGARPVPREVVTGASGSWIVTDLIGVAGIVIGALHFGHGPVRPANWSLTRNVALQAEQRT